MRRSLLAAFCLGICTLATASIGYANGIFENVRGDVRVAAGSATPASVARNERFVPGTTVTTGPGAQTTMLFDDGHTIILGENTEFRVNRYSFDKDRPEGDSIALELVKGALRSVTGFIGARSRNAFALVAPQATIGIRGTDFMIALVNRAYLSVLQGTIGVSNTAGATTFSAGTTATVASSTTLAAAISPAALPASVASTFGNLSSIPVGAAGAGAASGAAAGGITAGMIAAGVAVIGVAAGAASSSGSESPSTTTTSTQ